MPVSVLVSILLGMCFFFSSALPVCASDDRDKGSSVQVPSVIKAVKEKKWESFGFDLGVGMHQSYWFPGYYNKILKYSTQGLQSTDLKVGITYAKKELLYIKYERPTVESSAQNDMLKTNSSRKAGIERFKLGVSLAALAGQTKEKSKFMRAVYSTRFETTRELFFGTATAKKTFAYAPHGTDVTWTSPTTVTFNPPLQAVNAGDKMSFNTEFKDYSVSLFWPQENEKRRFDFGLGYFDSQWLRPSSHDQDWVTVPGDLPIIYETTFKSRGIQFLVETVDKGRPGFNGDLLLRWGFDNQVSNAVKRNVTLKSGEKLLYGSGIIDLWYNWYKDPETRSGVYGAIGFSADRRYFGKKIHPFEGGVEIDDIWKFYARIGIRF